MYVWLHFVLVTVFGIFAIIFAISNQTEVVVSLPGGWTLVDVPLFVMVFVPLLLGFLFGAFSGWAGGMKYRQRVDRLRNQKHALEMELTNLRNLPLVNDLQP